MRDPIAYNIPETDIVLCEDCAYEKFDERSLYPVWEFDEWDYRPHCDECDVEINVSLTEEGIKYEETLNEFKKIQEKENSL